MTKIKTSELTGAALDWAVAKCEEIAPNYLKPEYFIACLVRGNFRYSTDWAQGGPIGEQNGIQSHVNETRTEWTASCWGYPSCQYGATELIAKMRCYVASKLGEEVEVPDELC